MCMLRYACVGGYVCMQVCAITFLEHKEAKLTKQAVLGVEWGAALFARPSRKDLKGVGNKPDNEMTAT